MTLKSSQNWTFGFMWPLDQVWPPSGDALLPWFNGLCLPAPALVHKHQFTLHHSIRNSWFSQVRDLSQKYSLPDPMHILISPPPKRPFKAMVKTAISSFWRAMLIAEAQPLTSLRYMRFSFLPLGDGAHPIWWTCYSSSSAVRSATVMAKMISGRFFYFTIKQIQYLQYLKFIHF